MLATARNPRRNNELVTHPILAASYTELGRQRDAEGERAVVARSWPFFDAQTVADQLGTEEAKKPNARRTEEGGI